MPGPALATRDTEMKKTNSLSFWSLFLVEAEGEANKVKLNNMLHMLQRKVKQGRVDKD